MSSAQRNLIISTARVFTDSSRRRGSRGRHRYTKLLPHILHNLRELVDSRAVARHAIVKVRLEPSNFLSDVFELLPNGDLVLLLPGGDVDDCFELTGDQ